MVTPPSTVANRLSSRAPTGRVSSSLVDSFPRTQTCAVPDRIAPLWVSADGTRWQRVRTVGDGVAPQSVASGLAVAGRRVLVISEDWDGVRSRLVIWIGTVS